MAALYRRPSLLGFPGVAPGFDPKHVAFRGSAGLANLFSIVLGVSGPIDLIGAKVYTRNGSPTFKLNGSVGPALGFTGTQSISTAMANITPTQFVVAAIIYTNSGADQNIVGIANNALFYRSTGAISIFPGTVIDGPSLAVNTPYFVAASWKNGVGTNFVVLNLATGALRTSAAGAIGTGGATGTTAPFGNNAATTGSQGFTGPYAAAMWFPNFLSMPELVQWAQDPWSFWYPRKLDLMQTLGNATVASFIPAWARGSNLPVLGTGTY